MPIENFSLQSTALEVVFSPDFLHSKVLLYRGELLWREICTEPQNTGAQWVKQKANGKGHICEWEKGGGAGEIGDEILTVLLSL